MKIPFSEALEQMPTYVKFMMDILSKKRRYMDQETINLDASCSSIIQRTILRKEIDYRRVTLPITIGNVDIGKSLVGLGSSINLITLSVVRRLGNIEIRETKMTFQLDDKSTTHPFEIVEGVLVKMYKFFFPINFVVMDMEENDYAPLILGWPFMKTARMMIDIDDGLMKVHVQDEEACFNLFEAMKNSKDKGYCFRMDAPEEAIMDVRRQIHLFNHLEKTLTDALEVLNKYEEK